MSQLQITVGLSGAVEPVAESPETERAADASGIVCQGLLECLLGRLCIPGFECTSAPRFHIAGPKAPVVIPVVIFGRIHQLLEQLEPVIPIALTAEVKPLDLRQ